MTNSNHYIFTTTVPMVTKPEKLVTCHEGLLPIMILHPLVTWFCKIMWQTKTIFYLLPQNLCPQNLAGWWLNLTAFYPQSQMTNHVVLEITWQIKNISPLSQCLRPQGLVGLEWLLPIKSRDHTITWCRKIIWETKTTYPWTQCLWLSIYEFFP